MQAGGQSRSGKGAGASECSPHMGRFGPLPWRIKVWTPVSPHSGRRWGEVSGEASGCLSIWLRELGQEPRGAYVFSLVLSHQFFGVGWAGDSGWGRLSGQDANGGPFRKVAIWGVFFLKRNTCCSLKVDKYLSFSEKLLRTSFPRETTPALWWSVYRPPFPPNPSSCPYHSKVSENRTQNKLQAQLIRTSGEHLIHSLIHLVFHAKAYSSAYYMLDNILGSRGLIEPILISTKKWVKTIDLKHTRITHIRSIYKIQIIYFIYSVFMEV